MCRLKRWPPKSPWKNIIQSQEFRAEKSFDSGPGFGPRKAVPFESRIRVPDSGPEKSYTIRAPKRWLVDTNVQIETVASKESLEKHPQPRAPGPEKLFDSPRKVVRFGPRFGPRKAVPFGSRIRAPKSRIPFEPRKDGWWTQMCKLKQWHPKSPWRNIHSQEPRAPKSCSIRAPIRAPKSCSIRVPDSGPEKSYTIRAPKRWLVDTNVQNGGLQRAPETVFVPKQRIADDVCEMM